MSSDATKPMPRWTAKASDEAAICLLVLIEREPDALLEWLETMMRAANEIKGFAAGVRMLRDSRPGSPTVRAVAGLARLKIAELASDFPDARCRMFAAAGLRGMLAILQALIEAPALHEGVSPGIQASVDQALAQIRDGDEELKGNAP